MNSPKEKNYYDILEAPTNATPEEIHEGYNRTRNAYSQDSIALYSLMSHEECEQMLKLVDEAYVILSDPNKRLQYDKARGITLSYNPFAEINHNVQNDSFKRLMADPIEQKTITPSQSQNITKIVATKRYALEHKIDNELEREIEEAVEFSGKFLKRIREYKEVNLVRMADITKVSKTYLQYIEEEEFKKLPAPVYVRGFVFQYAKILKLNPELVANSFLAQMKKALGPKS